MEDTQGQIERSLPKVEKMVEEHEDIDVIMSLNDPTAMGASAIKAAYELLAGKDVDKTVTIPVKLITKENVSEYDLERWQ